VTPAMNNLRYNGAAAAAAAPNATEEAYPRSTSPNGRNFAGSYNNNAAAASSNNNNEPNTPSSTGLIRLSLKKPMGIVFEPMYDPNQPSIQRGVRICDLPRTGAAALSRKLQVGDELLQINETVVSRLTFDEIMDFIIEADPDSVNLLFRRPRKETLQARQGVQQKLNAAANKDNPSTVKWVDEEGDEKGKKKKKSSPKKKKDKKKDKRNKKGSTTASEDEDVTLQSKSTAGEESYVPKKARRSKKSRSRGRNPYETESFLDMLIDTICSDSNNVCRDTFRRADDDYPSDDESFGTEEDETYATYEESLEDIRNKKGKDDKANKKKYEDDGTLETVETRERAAEVVLQPPQEVVPPLGLAPNPPPHFRGGEETDDDGNPAPIKELEYDDRIDHGADVSVMESLGGPSLLIEKQRAAQMAAAQQTVPPDILDKYGLDYGLPGMTREQSVSADPLKYYTHVVKQLLEQHEPEKVRLLDKLLAKYKGREDHLVQKLAVRYSKTEENEETAFTDAVKKNKQSANAQTAVNTAKERLQHQEDQDDDEHDHNVEVSNHDWPAKETKEQDEGDEDNSESGSDYSRDSVDGTSPAVIAQVSELLNYVYGKTSVPGQIDRVSTIMRAYEGREAVLLELLETKALIKANKEKENADNLPSFLRNSQLTQAQKDASEVHNNSSSTGLPPVTPMATNPEQGGTVINDDISSMSGVSSPAAVEVTAPVEAPQVSYHSKSGSSSKPSEPSPMSEAPKVNSSSSGLSKQQQQPKPPPTPDKRKKKGLFGGLFGKKNKSKDSISTASPSRPGSRLRPGKNKLKGVRSVEGSI